MKNKKDKKIKNWEKENELLERKMYRLYKDDFAKRRKGVLNLTKANKVQMITV
ncbi:MAG: hypothetical protein AAB525_02050 [Patescibacteria group bacterium]